MANENGVTFDPGEVLYFLHRDLVGNVCDRSFGDGRFVAFAAGSYANYYTSMPENGTNGRRYVGSFETDIEVAGWYFMETYWAPSGTPSSGDPLVSVRPIRWDGAAEVYFATEPKQDIIAADVVNIDGSAMIGTNNAATETKQDAMKITTDRLADTLEDDAGTYRFTENALEEAPTAEMDPAELEAAMKAMTGLTVGGDWTWEKIMKITTAWIAGNWRVKPTDSTKQELMDAEDSTKIILEQTLTRAPGAGSNYRDITVII